MNKATTVAFFALKASLPSKRIIEQKERHREEKRADATERREADRCNREGIVNVRTFTTEQEN